MPTRPDLRPVELPPDPALEPSPDVPERYRLDPDEPLVRHDGTGTLLTVVTLFVVLTLLYLVAVG